MQETGKGSEWNKWDLHFHTPSSYDYGDKSVTNEKIIEKLKENNISVVAITDHHIIDISRIKKLQELGKVVGITILPGIEFLSDARGREPVHFIAIFAEESNIEYIWAQIENTTAIKDIKGKESEINAVYCDLLDTIKIVKELGGLVTIHAGEKSGSVENITHSLPHGTAQKTEIAHSVDIYELGKSSDQEGYNKFVFPSIKKTIPMIICSDNHNINKYIFKDNLWIKGTTSFNGLKYALSEPEDRFYIGKEPPALAKIRTNKTKYIKSIEIQLSGDRDNSNIWFENTKINLNKEMVTIIGNKGNGKSALADIISLCADGEHSEDYLFLHKDKFKKRGLAERFSATLEFEDGCRTEKRQLNHNLTSTNQPRVKYLPQSYFEKVCNEIDKIEAFRKEIEKVVFQYVPKEKQLNSIDFQGLVATKKESTDREISSLLNKINKTNNLIIDAEDKSNPEYLKLLKSKKQIKQSELDSHTKTKPNHQHSSTISSQNNENTNKIKQIEEWTNLRAELEGYSKETTNKITRNSLSTTSLNTIKRDIAGKINEIDIYINSKSSEANLAGINLNSILTIKFSKHFIDEKICDLENENSKLREELTDRNNKDELDLEKLNTVEKINYYAKKIEALTNSLMGEQKEHQANLEQNRLWSLTNDSIIGDKNSPGSLSFISEEIYYIEKNLQGDLNKLRSDRLETSMEIFKRKEEIKSFYDEIKNEISTILEQSRVSGLTIASSLSIANNAENEILKNIQQNKSGSFYGIEDGKKLLHNEIISKVEWNNSNNVETFLKEIIEYLDFDKRDGDLNNKKTFIGNQVKNRNELYDFIFSLSYLEAHYDLQQHGKSLHQLSPGEKGALLLVFYLILDKEDIPLIIDQPEDNLDNFSVASILVPYIKTAKKKRQIIIVTHNPNLAVVSDSEQIIKVEIDKEKGNIFKFISGGIDEKTINDAVIQVLEGTIPAFNTRKGKYHGI